MKHTALTIGPIYKTITKAKKTRELWGASYFLSAFMENVINELKSKGLKDEIIIPFPNARDFDEPGNYKSAGVFPDRLIMEGEHFDALNDAVNQTIERFKNYFPEECKGKLDDYFQKYFRFNIVEADIEREEEEREKEEKEKANVIFEMNKLLAASELQSDLLPEDPLCFEEFLWNIKGSGLYKQVFGTNRSFPSLIEISLNKMLPPHESELQEKLDKIIDQTIKQDKNDDSDSDIIKQINEIREGPADENKSNGDKKKSLKDYFKNPHKYIAIVQSDGDNVGKLIKAIYEKDPHLIKDFSKALSEFAFEAVKAIKNYGGEAVYAGGDDLLFFAPVITHEKNIINLLDEIDEIFNAKIVCNPKFKDIVQNLQDEDGNKITPSVSYGLSVTYYKFPMHEALKSAVNLLFGRAKSGKKNNIAYRFHKHSGQSFEDVLYKGENACFYDEFKKMVNQDNIKMLSSLLYNLENQKVIFQSIICDKDRMQAFFDNNYNEDIHNQNRDFINRVKDLLIIAYQEEQDIAKALKRVYNALRFIKFLNEKSHE